MLKRLCALTICWLICDLAIGQTVQRKFTPLEMREDIDTLVKYLEDAHPKPYYRYPKEKFYKDVEAVKRGLTKDLSKIDLYLVAEPLLGKLEDGHTDLHIMEDHYGQDPFVFPYSVKLSVAKPYIICTGAYHGLKAQLPTGAEVISINGIAAQKMVNDIVDLNTGENRPFRAAFGAGRFDLYLEALYKTNGSYRVVYKNKGITRTVLIKGLKKADRAKISKAAPAKVTPSATPNFSLKLIPESKTAIIYFRSFDWDGYKPFIDSAFTLIKNKGIQNLVIDLRDDEGGDSDVGDDLMQYLLDAPFHQYEKVVVKNSRFLKERLKAHHVNKPYDHADSVLLAKPNGLVDTTTYQDIAIANNSLRFTGKVYLLINIQTYSSASDFAQCFKYYKRGTIIGEETGGLVKSYGDIVPATLPHTGLGITISSSLYYDVGAKENDWKGVIPDVLVPSAKAMDKALVLIKGIKNSGN